MFYVQQTRAALLATTTLLVYDGTALGQTCNSESLHECVADCIPPLADQAGPVLFCSLDGYNAQVSCWPIYCQLESQCGSCYDDCCGGFCPASDACQSCVPANFWPCYADCLHADECMGDYEYNCDGCLQDCVASHCDAAVAGRTPRFVNDDGDPDTFVSLDSLPLNAWGAYEALSAPFVYLIESGVYELGGGPFAITKLTVPGVYSVDGSGSVIIRLAAP